MSNVTLVTSGGRCATAGPVGVSPNTSTRTSCRTSRSEWAAPAASTTNMVRRDFPLPRGTLPNFTASPEEHQDCKDFATKLLAHTVHEFERYAYEEKGVVGSRRWKQKTVKNDMALYRERDGGSMGIVLADQLHNLVEKQEIFSPTAATLIPPTLLLVGTRQGFVENAMSTLVTLSQDELALVVKFLHGDVADCAVLHTMEGPSPNKPFHFLGYKFFVTESAGGDARLIKRRHGVYLEYTGLIRSRTGEVLGYHIMQSVALPQFPDLSSRNSICTMTSMRYIYRQKADGLVEIFMLGCIDVGGFMFRPIAQMAVEDMTFGMTRILDCSETKRLTQMACEHQRRKNDIQRGRRTTRQESFGDDMGCSVCQTERRSVFRSSKVAPCFVCGRSACSRCRASKQIFVSSNDGLLGKLVKVPVCSICIMTANISYYEHQLRQQQKSSSGEEMAFQPMQLSDRVDPEESLSFSDSSSRGRSRGFGSRICDDDPGSMDSGRFFPNAKEPTTPDISVTYSGRQTERWYGRR